MSESWIEQVKNSGIDEKRGKVVFRPFLGLFFSEFFIESEEQLAGIRALNFKIFIVSVCALFLVLCFSFKPFDLYSVSDFIILLFLGWCFWAVKRITRKLKATPESETFQSWIRKWAHKTSFWVLFLAFLLFAFLTGLSLIISLKWLVFEYSIQNFMKAFVDAVWIFLLFGIQTYAFGKMIIIRLEKKP